MYIHSKDGLNPDDDENTSEGWRGAVGGLKGTAAQALDARKPAQGLVKRRRKECGLGVLSTPDTRIRITLADSRYGMDREVLRRAMCVTAVQQEASCSAWRISASGSRRHDDVVGIPQ